MQVSKGPVVKKAHVGDVRMKLPGNETAKMIMMMTRTITEVIRQ